MSLCFSDVCTSAGRLQVWRRLSRENADITCDVDGWCWVQRQSSDRDTDAASAVWYSWRRHFGYCTAGNYSFRLLNFRILLVCRCCSICKTVFSLWFNLSWSRVLSCLEVKAFYSWTLPLTAVITNWISLVKFSCFVYVWVILVVRKLKVESEVIFGAVFELKSKMVYANLDTEIISWVELQSQ